MSVLVNDDLNTCNKETGKILFSGKTINREEEEEVVEK